MFGIVQYRCMRWASAGCKPVHAEDSQSSTEFMRQGKLNRRVPFPYTPKRAEYGKWLGQAIMIRPCRRIVMYWLKQMRKRDGLSEAYKFRDWLIYVGSYPTREIIPRGI